jgi:hypothetical protein
MIFRPFETQFKFDRSESNGCQRPIRNQATACWSGGPVLKGFNSFFIFGSVEQFFYSVFYYLKSVK